jgi:hypothetical protein
LARRPEMGYAPRTSAVKSMIEGVDATS